jgi:hypothetical protein
MSAGVGPRRDGSLMPTATDPVVLCWVLNGYFATVLEYTTRAAAMRSLRIKKGFHRADLGLSVASFAIFLMVLAIGCCAPDRAEARTFGGYQCPDDCSEHEAGYRWADERDIISTDECPKAKSEPFYQGCIAFVRDPDRGADLDDDGKSIGYQQTSK